MFPRNESVKLTPAISLTLITFNDVYPYKHNTHVLTSFSQLCWNHIFNRKSRHHYEWFQQLLLIPSSLVIYQQSSWRIWFMSFDTYLKHFSLRVHIQTLVIGNYSKLYCSNYTGMFYSANQLCFCKFMSIYISSIFIMLETLWIGLKQSLVFFVDM